MKSAYEFALEFKRKHPMTIGWRIKQNASVVDRHVNSDEQILYAFVAQKIITLLIFGVQLLLLLRINEF